MYSRIFTYWFSFNIKYEYYLIKKTKAKAHLAKPITQTDRMRKYEEISSENYCVPTLILF